MGFNKHVSDTKILTEYARNGNKNAIAAFSKIAFYLAVGLHNIIHIFNPDMITFSGGVSNSFDLLKDTLMKELNKFTFKTPLKHVKIRKSNYSKDLGAIGAAYLSRE